MNEDLKRRLIAAARRARKNAYAPYSSYPVGAAAIFEGSRRIYVGTNVENASYGLTICAERNAIFQAVADGRRRLRAIAIVAGEGRPAAPCGACRQVIYEFGPDAEVVLASARRGAMRLYRAKDLLPEAFGPEDLT